MATGLNIKILFILVAFLSVSYSSSFEDGTEDIPFLKNPAKISENRDVSIGFKGSYSIVNKNYYLGVGISGYSNSRGFGFSYIRDSINYYSALFGIDYKNLLFGTKILFYGNDDWIKNSVTMSFLYDFTKINMKTGIVFDNVFKFDTTYNTKPLSVFLTNLGYFPFFKKIYYEILFGGDIYSFYSKLYDIKLSVILQKFFLNNPSIFLYLSGNVKYNKEYGFDYNPEFELGIKRKNKLFKYGFSINACYISDNKNILSGISLLLNPRTKKEYPKINVVISGESSENGFIINIKNIFSATNRIKRWVIFIYNSDNKIVRTYNGMGIPPSAIIWNLRDGTDDIVLNGIYKIDMIIVDTLNRKSISNKLSYTVR